MSVLRGKMAHFIVLDEVGGFYPEWCIVIEEEWDYSQIGISAYNPNALKRLDIINPTKFCILILEEW